MSPSSFQHLHNNCHSNWYRDKSLRWNVYHCLGMCLVVSYLGYDAALLTGLQAIPQWRDYFDNPAGNTLGLYAASFYIPTAFAAFLGDFIASRFGRRPAVIIGSLIAIVGSLVNALANSAGMWIGGRATIGFGAGIVKVATPALIQEIAHPRLRPILAACYWSFFHIGSVLASFLCFAGLYIPAQWSWRVPSLVQAVGPFVVALVAFSAPESPRWLLKKGRQDEALNVLAKYHANGSADDELVMWELAEIKQALVIEDIASHTRYRDFFKSPGNRKRLAVVLSLAFGLNWVGNGIIAYYLAPVLRSVGITQPVQITLINAGLSIWNLIFAVTASVNTEKMGRRPSFFISLWGMLLSYAFITGLSASFAKSGRASIGVAVIPFLFVYYAFYCIAWTPLPVMYSTEILPFSLRTKGLALFTAAGTGSNAFNQWVNPVALQKLKWKYYIVYICVIAVYLVITYFMYPETKNHTIEEVSVIFDRVTVAEPTPEVVEAFKKQESEKHIEDVGKTAALYR